MKMSTQGMPELVTPKGKKIEKLKISLIKQPFFQSRKTPSEKDIELLAQNISSQGLLQPITVRKVGTEYELISGQRRLFAHKYLEIKVIEAIVLDMSDIDAHLMHLSENLQREDLNPLEEAQAIKCLIEVREITITDAATRLGMARSTVSNMLRCLEACDFVLERFATSQIPSSAVKTVCDLPTDIQEILITKFIDNSLNLRQLEQLKSEFLNKTSKKSAVKKLHPMLSELKRENHPFNIKYQPLSSGHGRAVIDFKTVDEVEKFVALLKKIRLPD